MDTRSKILPSGEAAAVAAGMTAVTGYFEPVGLAEGLPPGEEIVAVVLPSGDELLPQRARAELAAALQAVRYVVMSQASDGAPELAALRPARVVRLEALHTRRARELRARVLDTHG